MTNPEKQLTSFKNALVATTRALAAKRTLNVQFGQGGDIALQPLSEMPSSMALPLVRGEAPPQ